MASPRSRVKCFTRGRGRGGKRKSHAAPFSYLLIFASYYDIVSHRLGIRSIQIMIFSFEVSKLLVAEDVNSTVLRNYGLSHLIRLLS